MSQVDAPDLNLIAWRRLLVAVSGCIAAWVLRRLIDPSGSVAIWIYALLLTGAWWAAIRFLLLDTWGRRFWIVWLAVSALLILLLGRESVNPVPSLMASLIFLISRKYRPYRMLTGQKRTRVFLLGLLTLILITLDWGLAGKAVEQASWFHGVGSAFARWSLGSLRTFWLFSLLQLFFRMRLHSMRMTPKLAVSGLFIALVPLVLVIVFAVVFGYGLMGGSRAARAKSMLLLWSRQTEQGAELTPLPFETVIHLGPGARALPGEPAPAWLDSFLVALEGKAAAPAPAPAETPGDRARPSSAENHNIQWHTAVEVDDGAPVQVTMDADSAEVQLWVPRDTTAYFHLDDALWLLRLRGVHTPAPTIDGYRLDEPALDHLAQFLGCDIGVMSPSNVVIGDADSAAIAAAADSSRARIHPRGHLEHEDTTQARSRLPWRRTLGFGGGFLDILYLEGGHLVRADAFFHLEARLSQLAREFLRKDYQFNQALVFGMAVIAGLFLIFEGCALFLGIRLTRGILSAVRALHQGTLRLAGGDLTTRIELPNQDELGDLANSFNEMTVAVQRGREAAIARESLERELHTARAIQEHLLPRALPEAPGFEITGTSVPSRQVGGDYFDFLSFSEGRLGIAIADVSGKGMPAALLMANLQASLQGQVIHPSTVAEVVKQVNTLLVRSTDSQMFATFFYGVLDCTSGTFTSVNAGHNPPLVLRADGSLEYLTRGGLLLGMLPGMSYEQETTTLAPGDLVVLYTDGVTEAEGPREAAEEDARKGPLSPGADAGGAQPSQEPAGDGAEEELEDDAAPMFGEERLIEVVRASAHRSAAEIKEAILAAVDRFAAGVPQSDDITLVLIKRRGDERSGEEDGDVQQA